MILERIKQFMDYKGISTAAFERSIGMANASFGKSLKKGGAIGTDKLEKILSTYPEISPVWLMTGRGEMLADKDTIPTKQQPFIADERLVTQGVTPELIMELLNRITEQAAEIGRLQEQIRQMTIEKEKRVSDAPISGTANVG